jgi:O-acetyl-ADP-ribose deacetylase (regulator of RNase III)
MIVSIEVRDIFTSPAQTLVCPVNTVGTMGKGLAKSFAKRYPGLEKVYQQACYNYLFSTKGLLSVGVGDDRRVLCFPTKHHWRNPSRLPWIDMGLKKLNENYENLKIESIAFPMIGCGEGMLEWDNVYPLIVEWLDPLPLPVHICLSPLQKKK